MELLAATEGVVMVDSDWGEVLCVAERLGDVSDGERRGVCDGSDVDMLGEWVEAC